MKMIWIILLLNCLAMPAKAQNLVNNWSFEDTIACPLSSNHISNAIGWSSFRLSPDYFNSCCTNPLQVGVPNNFLDYQYARTGNSYAGFISFGKTASELREWFGSLLHQQLIIGQKYFVSFFVNRPVHFVGNHVNVATNKIGIRFSTVAYTSQTGVIVPLNGVAQIYTDSIITDTLNWIRISGSFIADSAYQYLIIGNFFNDSATTHIEYDSLANLAYYFVDDICVSPDSNYCEVLSGVSTQITNNSIKIYPNPARDWIVLEGRGIKSAEIINTLGSIINFYPTEATDLQNKLNISSLSWGIYFLKVNMIDERFYLQKLVIQN